MTPGLTQSSGLDLNSYELQHRIKANRFLLLILALHVPVYTLFAALGLGSVLVALAGSLLLCAVPAILVFASPSSIATSVAISSTTMGMSMLLIFLGEGKIEYHFHVFSFLAVLCYLASPWSLIAAAGTIAVHHVAGWLLVPRALFNYDATFADVVVHALFVVVETAICCIIAQQFKLTIRMRGVLEERVGVTAEQVAIGAKEMASFVENFAQSASMQANMADQVVHASQKMKTRVTDNLAASAKTQQQIVATVDEIASVHSRLDQLNSEMQAVASMSQRISGIINLMMDIARQTNILAVNASIEASRSGNSGGGFGVIADQVRDLAVRTSEATSEIDSLLSNSKAKVDASAFGIRLIAENFGHLNKATQQMKSLLAEVNDLSRGQVAGIDEITHAMGRISAETQNFAAAAEQTSGTSIQLSELAGDLRFTLAGIQASNA